MKLLEYEAKQLLENADVPIPRSTLIDSVSHAESFLPCVLKSQVPTGGRGKLGGIKFIHTLDELKPTAKTMFDLSIKGYKPTRLLAEELLEVDGEYYLSLSINRDRASIELVAHRAGGMEIESRDGHEFFRHEITPELVDVVGDILGDYLDIPDHTFALQGLLAKLTKCFNRNDATLLEINPLVLTKQGLLVAGDCKMLLDDDAALRHPEWKFEEQPIDTNFVTLDLHGKVATIANGAGLAMATVDAVHSAGLRPANFLDIGGGATVDSIVASFTKLVAFPNLQAIIINIFGGIVRCDDVARAIIQARTQFASLPPLYIRLSGTNSEQAGTILSEHNLKLYPNLSACIEGVRRG